MFRSCLTSVFNKNGKREIKVFLLGIKRLLLISNLIQCSDVSQMSKLTLSYLAASHQIQHVTRIRHAWVNSLSPTGHARMGAYSKSQISLVQRISSLIVNQALLTRHREQIL